MYNQPFIEQGNITVISDVVSHWFLPKRAKKRVKKLEKIVKVMGNNEKLPIRGVCVDSQVYWGLPHKMYPLNIHTRYSWFEQMIKVENVGVNTGSGFVRSTEVAHGVTRIIHFIDMENRTEHTLTKKNLYELLKMHDPALYKEFKRRRNKDALLKEYFLKLLESL